MGVNLTAENAPKTPAKRKPGRQPGTPSPKSHYAPDPGLTTAQMRQFMRDKSKTVENLLRMADGKRVQLHGPTGKVYWAETTPAMMTWAMGQVL